MLENTWKLILTTTLCACFANSAIAGGADTAPPLPPTNPHPHLFPTAASLFAPVGFGADLGTIFAALGYVNRWPGRDYTDGNFLVGAGLGKSDKYVGLQVTGLVNSLGFNNTNFADSGSFGVKLFRWLTPNFSVAIGGANVGRWGNLKQDANSWYGSMTDYFSFFQDGRYPMAVTFGVGTGAFFSTAQFRNNSDNQIKPFGSVAVSIIPQLSAIVDYTTDMWSAGVSVVPYLPFPFAITAYSTNLGGGDAKAGPVTFGVRAAIGWTFV